MRRLIETLNLLDVETLACCCGHSRYLMTIVVRKNCEAIELFSGKTIKRVKKFYKKDKHGFYYIPETLE